MNGLRSTPTGTLKLRTSYPINVGAGPATAVATRPYPVGSQSQAPDQSGTANRPGSASTA